MPLPSSGSISADDLNEELGNSPGTQIDFESAAISLLETATRPHSMDEFYGTSLGEDFLFSDWDGSVSITEFGVISVNNVGNAGPVTINTSTFDEVTTSTPQSVNVTITAPSEFDGKSVTNAGELISGDTSTTQPAVGRYLSISADDTSLAGDDTSLSLTVTDRFYTNTPWEITTETISSNTISVVSVLPTGTGTETVNLVVDDNPNGSTRNIRFKVTGTVGGKSSIVDVSQASYTPIPEPTIAFSSISPSGPYSYNGISRITYVISRTNASSFSGQISPAIDGNNAVFSSVQPTGITYNGPTSITGYSTTFYVEIPARDDGEEDTKNSFLNVSVSTGGGFADADNIIQQEGLVLPTYTWGGSVSIDTTTGDVVVNGDDSAGTITISPISFNEYVTTSTPREVTIGNIVIPSGYQNPGSSFSLTRYPTQSAIPRTLTFTPQSSTTFAGNITSFNFYVDDLYYTDTSWDVLEGINNTLVDVQISPTAGSGPEFVVITFDSNNLSERTGTFILSGGESYIPVTLTQERYVPPATISIDSILPSGPYSYSGEGRITVNITRTNASSFSSTISPSIEDTNAIFSELQPSGVTRNNSRNITGTSSTFYIEIPSRSDGTTTTYSNQLSVSAGDATPAIATLEQEGLVQWNTSPSSLSFDTLGGSQNITLNSSYSWTASVSGTGFSINTTSGTAGTSTISVTATQKDLGGSGTVTFSASGQSDIVVSLSQAAAPLEYDWFVNGLQRTGNAVTVSPSTTNTSYSVGLYTYRGSTAVPSTWMLQRTSGTWITINTTTFGGTSFKTTTSTQNTSGTPNLYLNVADNTGGARTGGAEITVDGLYVATINVSQSGVSGGTGVGDKPTPDPGEEL